MSFIALVDYSKCISLLWLILSVVSFIALVDYSEVSFIALVDYSEVYFIVLVDSFSSVIHCFC